MTTAISYECKGCGEARRKARRIRRIVGCVMCLSLHDPADDEPAGPNVVAFLSPDGHRYDAKRDMAAIAQTGGAERGLHALPLEPQIRGGHDGDDVTDADVARHLRERRAMRGSARLDAMRARATPDGKRFADVVWYVYGYRGEQLNEWGDSAAAQVAILFARPGERAAMRTRVRHEHPRLTDEQVDKRTPLAFGNLLVGLAVAAYETDAWSPVIEPAPPSPRERFVAGVAERWEAAKAALLKKTTG